MSSDVVLIEVEDGLEVNPVVDDIVIFTQANSEITVEITGLVYFPFTNLLDVPASYAGQGTKLVRVKADASGLEFIDTSVLMDNGISGVSLNAVAVTGDGTAVDFAGVVRTSHSMRVTITGAPSAAIVDLYGYLDNWFVMASWDLAGDGRTSGQVLSVYNTPVLKTRATLRTLTGGTAPTVTAFNASK